MRNQQVAFVLIDFSLILFTLVSSATPLIQTRGHLSNRHSIASLTAAPRTQSITEFGLYDSTKTNLASLLGAGTWPAFNRRCLILPEWG